MYEIDFTQEALNDLKSFRKFEQAKIIQGIEAQLQYEPNVETRNRKLLRSNNLAEWELRIDHYRVFYNVETVVRIVSIEAIGFKLGNILFIRGDKREL